MIRQPKLCPFCGKPAEIEDDYNHESAWFHLGCSDHNCIARHFFYGRAVHLREVCIVLWNRRAETDSLRAQRDELAACLKELIFDAQDFIETIKFYRTDTDTICERQQRIDNAKSTLTKVTP